MGGNLLEGKDNILDEPEVGFGAEGELPHVFLGDIVGDDKISNTLCVEVVDIATACIALGGDGKKEAAWQVGGATAVGEKLHDLTAGVGDMGRGASKNG